MPKAILFCLLFVSWGVLTPSVTFAADIVHEEISDGRGVIAISGDIKKGDAEKFRSFSVKYKEGIVVLNSDGGALAPAIEIGKIIKIAGYVTFVPAEATCTSSCALIWVAGSSRLMSSTGNVGFHASYRDNNGRTEESGLGNALVGNYLTILNLPQKAIVFATIASPDKIMWLTKANMDLAGIDFDEYDFEDQSQANSRPKTVSPPPVVRTVATPTTTTKIRSEGANWIEYSSATNGMVSYYDANSISRSGASAMVWILRDHSKDSTVSYRQSKELRRVNCLEKTGSLLSYVNYDKNGIVVASHSLGSHEQEIEYLVPGTVGMTLWEHICE